MRATKTNQMIIEFILTFTTEKSFHKIANEDAKYTLTGCKSTTLLCKVLMTKSIVDTRATTLHFWNILDSLEEYTINVGSNIEIFNMHVKYSEEGLKARGQTIDDLILNLFKGYKATSNSKFVEYTEKKDEKYMDGEDIEDDYLVQLTLNKYTTHKQNNTWGVPSIEQEQLTALTS